MLKKIAIVTGANSGMGLATTISLAKQNIHVIMVCRNPEKGKQALYEAKKASGSGDIELMLCDLSSLSHIRQFCDEFKSKYPKLDILINNAGVVSLKRQETVDGFEAMLGVNHLGHFLLTNLLLDHLKAAPQGRIVVVSSGAHKWGKMDFEDPYFKKGYNVVVGYGRSKLANVLFTRGLAQRLEGTNVTVNSLHPGAVATNLGVDRTTGFGKDFIKLLVPFFRTAEEGAKTAIFLATSPAVEKTNGHYFYNEKEAPMAKTAKDDELVEQFWRWSEGEVGLSSPNR
ncbi:SDR family oxidoreductase [Cytobacillus gottheilii]|uniref:SDR family oxidoreductase n=1 Tax=Cytobacillus gottheilii TaxID=859144 RepID=UPI001117DD2A|nr:SDR family oxidoreductase [Cytobacillus gottheilii]